MKLDYKDLGLESKLRLKSGRKKVFYIEDFSDLNSLKDIFKNKKYKIIGGLSNTVISPFSKYIFLKTLLKGIYLKKGKIFVYAGTKLSEALNFQIKNKISCLEFLAGIPQAEIGGLIAQNASAFGISISDVVDKIFFFDIKKNKIYFENATKEFFSYRNSIFKHENLLILGASFKYNFDFYVKEKIKSYVKKRLEKQPHFVENTLGSTFKNPKQYPAGYLLEKVFLKGFHFKNFKFSEKHANFLINLNPQKASFFELLEIIYIAKEKVKNLFNISLELEIEIF